MSDQLTEILSLAKENESLRAEVERLREVASRAEEDWRVLNARGDAVIGCDVDEWIVAALEGWSKETIEEAGIVFPADYTPPQPEME